MEEGTAPQVSIIVPVYNVEGYLRRCLDSIERQTLVAWECICVDDGSLDGCGAILDEYAAKDARFVVIHQENGGVSRACNAGVDAACAEFIGFVDPDDWIEPRTYEAALETARRTGADIVQWGSIAERGEYAAPAATRKKKPAKQKREGFFDVRENEAYSTYAVWNKLFRRAFLFENGIRFPADVRRGEDVHVSIVSYASARSCFYLDRPLYHYDVTRETSTCHNPTEEMFLETEAAFKKTVALLEEEHGEWCSTGGGYKIIFLYKLHIKILYKGIGASKGGSCPHYNWRLFRSVFPELNRQMPLYFLKERTKGALVMLLAVWHMGWLEEAIFWVKGKFRT